MARHRPSPYHPSPPELALALGDSPNATSRRQMGFNAAVGTTAEVLWSPSATPFSGHLTTPATIQIRALGNLLDTAAGTLWEVEN